MEWYINDMSLNGQFANPGQFREALKPLLQLRLSEPNFRDRLYCSRTLASQKVTETANIQQAILALNDKNYTQQTLSWLGKSGPFWDDDRQYNEDDYFECQGTDVTDQGLGEAARRKNVGDDANTFSFQGGAYAFEETPLSVQHGLPEEVISNILVDNYWEVASLKEVIASFKTINSWRDVSDEITKKFPLLITPISAFEPLYATPFSRCVAKRIFELLHVLNKVAEETDTNGQLSEAGLNLLTNHFAGGKAWFTDESERNKINFKTEMTFKDPKDDAKKIFCPWHGKIKTPQTRIHFEWPRPANQHEIKVLFLGPKITKG